MSLKPNRERLLIFLILLVCYTYFLPRWADWNQNSRFDMVRALVEQNTLIIDDYYANTGDYATVDGHIYSDKAPGLSYAAVPIYAVFYRISNIPAIDSLIQRLASSPAFGDTLNSAGSGLLADKVRGALGLMAVTFFLVMLPSAVLGVLLYEFLGHLGFSRTLRVAAPLVYGLATMAFPYSGAFYGHQFAAVLLFGAFHLAFLMKRGRLASRTLLPIGFLLSYAIISEYPVGLIAVAIALYAISVAPDRRWVLGAILTGLPPMLLLGLHNNAIFGTPFKLGYEYSTLWQDNHTVGFMSLTIPSLESIWGITFGVHRGLFFSAPVLLLVVPGLYLFWKQRAWRAEWVVCTWAVLSFMLFNAASIMWQGGFSVGPRYLVPMLPFAAVGLAYAIKAALQQRWSTIVLLVLTVWSFAVIWIQTISGQDFPDYTPNPLFDFSLPKLFAGDIARNLGMAASLRGLISLLPLVIVQIVLFGLLVQHRIGWRTARRTQTLQDMSQAEAAPTPPFTLR